MGSSSLFRKRLLIAAAAFFVVAVGGFGLYVAASAWSQVNRVDIERPEPGAIEDDLGVDDEPGSEADPEARAPDPPSDTDGTEVFLLVGSDSREQLSETTGFGDFEGRRADVVMVAIRSHGEAAILSLPRDLWVQSSCSGDETRLNEELEGCGMVNGPTLLTVTVERIIGETVDHFALVDLAGFQEVVDAVGGYEICVDRPVRDQLANLDLPAGCTMASGEQTLAWLRSRHTQELTDSGWRTMPGVNDLARNKRQRDFLIEMMGRLSDFTSPQALTAMARAVAPHITVDSELSLMTAVNMAWDMRGLDDGDVTELEVPVYDYTTDTGAAVLLPSTPVEDVVADFLSPETVTGDPPALGSGAASSALPQ